MGPDHERALTDLEQLLERLPPAAAAAADAQAAEREAELRVLVRLVELLSKRFELLADVIIIGREEYVSEAQPSLGQFRREDYPEKGVLLFRREREGGTGQPGRLHLWARYIYVLSGARLLLVESEGFREERRRRGSRPDRHEHWTARAAEVTCEEALDRIDLIEAALDTVREQVELALGLAEDTTTATAERTAQLLKLVDGLN